MIRLFTITAISCLLLATAGISEAGNVLLIVNDQLYPDISSDLAVFISDLNNESYTVETLLMGAEVSPESIREALRDRWEIDGLEGAILIGDLPAAYTIILTGNFANPDSVYWYFSLDACDPYYYDLDGDWDIVSDIDQRLCADIPDHVVYCHEYPSCAQFHDEFIVFYDAEAPAFDPGQYEPEIWLGRIMGHNLQVAAKSESEIIQDYLQANHQVRTGVVRPASTAVFCDGINDPVIDQEMDFSGIFAESIRHPLCPGSDYLDYLQREEGSSLVYALVHSSPTWHSFPGGSVGTNDLLNITKNAIFYILNACSACRWDHHITLPSSPNYLGGMYVFAKTHTGGDYGMGAIGFTGVGGFNNLKQFSDYLQANGDETYGKAYKYWYSLYVHQIWGPHNYVFLGDPTIGPVKITTGVFDQFVDEGAIPSGVAVYQNYPNPFNASTVIRYDLAEEAQVHLEVFDILGHRVMTLIDEYQPAGFHQVTWNGSLDDETSVASGVYLYRITANGATRSRKMVLLK